MKKSTSLLALVLVAAGPVSGQSESGPLPFSTLVDTEVTFGRDTTRDAVRLLLGPPNEVVTSDLWVYWNFRPPGTGPALAKLDTLVLAFKHDRISLMRLCESRVVRELVAKQKRHSDAKIATAK